MAPIRTSQPAQEAEGSSSGKPEKQKFKRKQKHAQDGPSRLPGVQKIKSSLRQTKRLLAKDNLAADIRIETERRLKALEADLAQAEASRKERNMAVRYHKVKFFERQKVLRKLNQVKKLLDSVDKASKSRLERALFELRINLNYTVHYPKNRKYVSLFPPDIREDASSKQEDMKVNPESQEVRSWIRNQMESGGLPSNPELQMDSRGHDKKSFRTWDENKKPSKSVPSPAKAAHSTSLEDDEFFGSGKEDEEESE